ncbi:hypothetical protein C2845_PM01G25970 [Panicum miliaceum]|uniref:Uncharacterized protein n=1 Tax=Panicum miliaceum TaxID=4540 RepID=A0A3L6THV3_PANMI|nr:hypothetical protein C2845_PM01G25970 [Panicum miliaceum]
MASTAVAGGQVLDGSKPVVARVRQLIGGPEYCQGTSLLAICASMQTISDYSCAQMGGEPVLGGRRDAMGPGPAHAGRLELAESGTERN